MRNLGFTLVELIIVISITTLLGLILTDVLIETLRGETKVKVVSQTKQNGQLVLERLVNMIRQGEKIICAGDSWSDKDTLIIFNQGTYTRFRYVAPSPGTPTPKNGFIASDTFNADQYPTGVIDQSECEESSGTSSTLIHSPVFLTDLSTTEGVSIGADSSSNTIFIKDQLAGYNDAVSIKFRISAGVLAGSAYEATVKEGGILFNTTVGLRSSK